MMEETTFLYVEDDARSREVMELIMTMAMGVKNLVMFENSTEFASRLAALSPMPNVILLDIHVKPYDGFEMLRMIREHPTLKNATVIALTASVMNEEVEMMRTRGFDGAIGKPLSMSLFPDLIKRVIEGQSVWHTT